MKKRILLTLGTLQLLALIVAGWTTACGPIPAPPGVATPTATGGPVPTATFAPSAASATSTTKASPTSTKAPQLRPPTVDFINGGNCAGGVPGNCEFNTWMRVSIPDPANFTPPCDPGQCPAFWRPSGMALACDHMFTDPGASGGVIDPKTQKWVSVMWYVCSGRIWDYPGDIQVEAAPGSRMCGATEPPGNCVKWEKRTVRPDDGYNGSISGNGSYNVRLPWGAFACKDPNDYNDHSVYTTGVCPSGNVALPGAGAVNGPFTVHQ